VEQEGLYNNGFLVLKMNLLYQEYYLMKNQNQGAVKMMIQKGRTNKFTLLEVLDFLMDCDLGNTCPKVER
jgi:hypothetical protein